MGWLTGGAFEENCTGRWERKRCSHEGESGVHTRGESGVEGEKRCSHEG